MKYLVKLTTIGPTRKLLYQYIRQIPGGGDLADFSSVSPETPVSVAIKVEDHHAKLHIHTMSDEDPQPEQLVIGLAKRYPDLRFTLYYEHPGGYGTIHAWGGKVQSHAQRQK